MVRETFDKHPKSVYWSPRNKVRPCDVALHSHKEFWFDCPNCRHEFQCQPHQLHKAWCGYCHKKKLCENLDCNFCFDNSFASSDKSKFWSSRNEFSPREVFKYSSKKFWFNCDVCNHEFDSTLGHIKDNWCSYCANKKLCDSVDCESCFNKSFDSEYRSIFWSNKNSLNPRQVFKVSKKKYIFECGLCKLSFEKRLDHISHSKSWCPNCFNKTETRLYIYLKQFCNVLKNVKHDWCRNQTTYRKLEYDFVIPDLNLIIELDGSQHFRQISNWSSPDEQLMRDTYKTKCANENGYKVIRLLQEEVFYNDSSWLDINLKPYLTTQNDNIFIVVNEKYRSIYDKHKESLCTETSTEGIGLNSAI